MTLVFYLSIHLHGCMVYDFVLSRPFVTRLVKTLCRVYLTCFLIVKQDWFEQYRELVIQTEQKILTILDFELEVEHPCVTLTSVFNKYGLSKSVLFTLSWNLVSEGYGSS